MKLCRKLNYHVVILNKKLASTENLPHFISMYWSANFTCHLAMRLQNQCVWRKSAKNVLDYDTALNCWFQTFEQYRNDTVALIQSAVQNNRRGDKLWYWWIFCKKSSTRQYTRLSYFLTRGNWCNTKEVLLFLERPNVTNLELDWKQTLLERGTRQQLGPNFHTR